MDQVLGFFITNAYAENADAVSAQGSNVSLVLMVAVFFLFIYFGVWRPQNKRSREQQSLLNSLAKGDEVLTSGGILGRITHLTEQYLILSIANNVDITIQKSSIVNVLPKGTMKSLES